MKIIVDGLATEYSESGSGLSVLVLHGWGSSSDVFAELIATLSKSHRVIALNLPGFGGTEQPKSVWGIADYAWFVEAFLKKIKLKPHYAIGHSFGGQIAVNMVGNDLIDPSKLVLIGASVIRPKPNFKKRCIQALAKVGKTTLGKSSLGEAAKKRLYASVGSSEYLDIPAMQPIYRRVITESQVEAAGRIDCPTLLVWGQNDSDTPLAQGRQLNALITGSKLEIFPGTHFVFLDSSAEVNQTIKEFLV